MSGSSTASGSYSDEALTAMMADLESDLVERKESLRGDAPDKVRTLSLTPSLTVAEISTEPRPRPPAARSGAAPLPRSRRSCRGRRGLVEPDRPEEAARRAHG